MAKWTEVDIYTGLVKNVDEDVPANFAGQGSKVALPPDAQMKKKKKLLDARTKVYRQHRERLEKLRAQREAKRKSMKEHKGTTPHKHPHEDDEIDEGKYLKYSNLLLKKAKELNKGYSQNALKAINKEIEKEKEKLGIREETIDEEGAIVAPGSGSIAKPKKAKSSDVNKSIEQQMADARKEEVKLTEVMDKKLAIAILKMKKKDLFIGREGAMIYLSPNDRDKLKDKFGRLDREVPGPNKGTSTMILINYATGSKNYKRPYDTDKKNMISWDKGGKSIGTPKTVGDAMKLAGIREEVVKEGTWHIAKNMTKLKKTMKKPMPYNQSGFIFVAKHIGDDELFDDLQGLKREADMVPAIKKAMKRLGIKEEISFADKVQEQIGEFGKESLLAEDNMEVLKSIVKNKSAKNIKMKDGNLKMDMFTASAIMNVYDKVNPSNKKKIEALANGKKRDMMKLQSMAMKLYKK